MIRIKNPTPPKIPVEYQELDYIESTGTQYIDTGVINVTGDVVDVSFQATSVPSSGETYIYAMYKSDTEKFRCGFNWGKFFTTGGFSYSQTGSLTAKTIGTGNCTVDTTLSAYLFSQHESAGAYHTANSKYKLYYCKIYRTNVLIRDFVPCYRKSDNKPGLYDTVNNVFYTNAGTGTFLMGNVVEGTARDLNINPAIFNLPMARGYINGKLFYGEEPQAYEQLVNYTMLYDGSLGDTELNECKDITGGYIHNSGLSSFWVQSDLTRNTNSLSTSLTNSTTSKGKTGSLVTFSEIDLTQYVKVANRYSFTHTNSSSSYNLIYTIRLIGRDVSHNTLGNPVIFTVKNTKDPYMNVDDGDYFITRNVSAFGLSPNKAHLSISVMAEYKGTINANIYALALFKQDNWQQLCTIAGLNSSNYTDEATLCANSTAISTILSNQEAVEYMIYNCTGSFMAEFVASSTCLTALNNSAYNTTIQANEHWNKFLAMVA